MTRAKALLEILDTTRVRRGRERDSQRRDRHDHDRRPLVDRGPALRVLGIISDPVDDVWVLVGTRAGVLVVQDPLKGGDVGAVDGFSEGVRFGGFGRRRRAAGSLGGVRRGRGIDAVLLEGDG